MAFRYWITDGGNWGSNGTYIGLDDVQIYRGYRNVNIEKYNNGIILKVYPNPAKNKLTIESNKKIELEIKSVEGQMIKRLKLNDNITDIDISNFTSGVYIIQAKTDRGTTTKLFIKE